MDSIFLSRGVAGCPRRKGSGQATKRRESALLAEAIRVATCLGARGRPSLPQYKNKRSKTNAKRTCKTNIVHSLQSR